MCKVSVLFCICLIAVSLGAGSCRYHQRRTNLQYSPELMRELRDFVALIPSITVDELVAEHMLTDSGFRKAIKFLRSADFKRLQQHAEQLPEVIELINFVHLNDNATSSLGPSSPSSPSSQSSGWHRRQQRPVIAWNYSLSARSVNSFETVVVLLQDDDELQRLRSTSLHSFISFVQELLTHLPRDRFVALINEKRQRCAVFAQFYDALRSSQFKPLVDTAMKSQNVASIISTLSSHAIDAQSLKAIGYEVISWGPALS